MISQGLGKFFFQGRGGGGEETSNKQIAALKELRYKSNSNIASSFTMPKNVDVNLSD